MVKMYRVHIEAAWEVPVQADNPTAAEMNARELVIGELRNTPLLGGATFHFQASEGPTFESIP